MKNIVIIGAGQLGSRYLQGFCKLKIPIALKVVEPDEVAKKIAMARVAEQISSTHIKNIEFGSSIDVLDGHIDLAVVSTSSDVRFGITSELLQTKKVENLILEKVLFQKKEEYLEIEKLLTKYKVNCWVNHTRRMFPFYQELRKLLTGVKNIHFSVSGGNWGLGCNALHYLDMFSFLTGETDLIINIDFLNKKIYKSKREGFFEFNGMISGAIGNATFAITSFDGEYSPIQLGITSDLVNLTIDESSGWFRISKKKNNWHEEEFDKKIVFYQSEIADQLAYDVFSTNCNLPLYTEAKKIHLIFIKSLIEHLNSFARVKYSHCPIT